MIIHIKRSLTQEIFTKHPHLEKELWQREFWTDGFFAATV
jgi:REP element-mobilizing transposase RayT